MLVNCVYPTEKEFWFLNWNEKNLMFLHNFLNFINWNLCFSLFFRKICRTSQKEIYLRTAIKTLCRTIKTLIILCYCTWNYLLSSLMAYNAFFFGSIRKLALFPGTISYKSFIFILLKTEGQISDNRIKHLGSQLRFLSRSNLSCKWCLHFFS